MLDLAANTTIEPEAANPLLSAAGSRPVNERERVATLARRPKVSTFELLRTAEIHVDPDVAAWADIELKYSGYLERERASAGRLAQMDDFVLPGELEYRDLNAVSFEAREKLTAMRPKSLGEAGRIPGVSPSDLQGLVMAVLKFRRARGVSRETRHD